MAKRKELEKGVQCQTYLDESMVMRLEALADKAGLSRSRLVRNLIEMGIEEMEMMDAIGLLTFVRRMEMARESLKQAFSGGATPVEA